MNRAYAGMEFCSSQRPLMSWSRTASKSKSDIKLWGVGGGRTFNYSAEHWSNGFSWDHVHFTRGPMAKNNNNTNFISETPLLSSM